MNNPENTPEQNNTIWRNHPNDDQSTSAATPAQKKKKIAVYGAAAAIADTLPILDRPPMSTSNEPDVGPGPNTTPPYQELASETKTIEGFVDTDKEFKEAQKNPIEWFTKKVMVPIKFCAAFKPKMITHNKYTDQFLTYLAGKDIANDWLDRASAFTEKHKDVLRADKLKALVQKVKNTDFEEVAADVTDQLGDGLKKVCKGEADGGSIGSNTEGFDDVSGGIATEGFEGDTKIKNPTLELDKATVKDYMFRTIILVVSFITVHSWAYLFLVAYGDKSNWIERQIQIFGSGIPDMSKWMPFGGIITQMFKFLYEIYLIFDPFNMSARGIAILRGFLEKIAKTDMNDKYDKKIWFVVIFYATFLATTFFIENYDFYMHGVENFKPNSVSGTFYALFVCLYLRDIITYIPNPSNWKEITVVVITNFFGFIYLLLKNIYVLVCLYYNQHYAVFAVLFAFMLHSLAAIMMYPSIDPFKFFDRFQKLKIVINADVEEKLALDELDPMPSMFTRIYRIFRKVIHFLYDHLFFMSTMAWILYMYYVFDKQLTYTNLRMNVFAILAVSIFTLIILKFVQLTFS